MSEPAGEYSTFGGVSARGLYDKALRRYAKDTVAAFRARPLVRAAIWAKTDGKCWYCGKQCNPFLDFSIDHVAPKNSGGNEDFDNLVPCCRRCNARKRHRTVEELRAMLAAEEECGGLSFTKEQLAFLEQRGLILVSDARPEEYLFFFERQERARNEIRDS